MIERFTRYGLLIVIVQLLIACSPADNGDSTAELPATVEASAGEATEEMPTETPEADTLIVAFGDSLYAGYGLPAPEGFAPELQKALNADGRNVKVHNAGVSGDTTAGGLRRMDFVLDSLPRKPDLVILGLGGNDLLRGLKPADTRDNLEAMIGKLSAREIPVMLTGMLAPPNLGAEYSDEFNVIYPALARKYDASLYPFFLDGIVGRKEYLLPDGLHPNAEGIDLIVEKIAPAVQQAIAG